MSQVFETKRLRLREWTNDDAENLYRLNLDPDVIKYTGDPPFTSLDDARQFILNYKGYQLNGYGRWAIELKSNDKFIGWSGLKLNELNKVDLGYRLLKSEWSKGYATEAALACLKFGFEKLGLKEVIARSSENNIASLKVIKKLRMEYYKEDLCKSIDKAKYYRIGKANYLSKFG